MPVENVITGETIESEWGNDVANTVNAIEADVSSASSAPTPNKLPRRDAAGRFQSATPAATSDVATMGWVRDTVGASDGSPGQLVRYDPSGRFFVAEPTLPAHPATAQYVQAFVAGSGTPDALPGTLLRRGADGNAFVTAPSLPLHIANAQYVQSYVGSFFPAGGSNANGVSSVAYFRLGQVTFLAGQIAAGVPVTIIHSAYRPAADKKAGGIDDNGDSARILVQATGVVSLVAASGGAGPYTFVTWY